MEKLPMCRICLADNVRMFVVVNTNLHKLYEKLTDTPFVTEDRRPILACFICCAKLKQCYRLLRQCVEAEELFALMVNEDYEPDLLINKDQFVLNGFIKSPIVHITIVDECQTESMAIKDELPEPYQGLDVIIKEEHQSDELEPENLFSSWLDVTIDDEPLMEIKTEVEEEQDVSKNKRRARKKKSATPAERPKLDTRRIKIEDDSEINQNSQHRTTTPATKYNYTSTNIKHGINNSFSEMGTLTEKNCNYTGKKPHKCGICQCRFSHKGHLTRHIRMHTGEKPNKCEVCGRSFSQFSNLKRHIRIHTDEKRYKCNLCHRSFNDKRDLSKHIRVHNGDKPFKCDICQLSFDDKRVIIKHIRKHTGEKGFKCGICHHSFSYSCDLKKHVRIHTGEKPYKCEICQRHFSVKSNLKRHFSKHTVEKPFK